MKFTGNERFPVPRGNRLVSTRLADITDYEILFMANGFQREGDPEPARVLLDYLQRRRTADGDPGPQAA